MIIIRLVGLLKRISFLIDDQKYLLQYFYRKDFFAVREKKIYFRVVNNTES